MLHNLNHLCPTHLMQHSVQCRSLALGPPLPQVCRPSQRISLAQHCVTQGTRAPFSEPAPLRGLMARCARAQIANSWGQSVDKGSYAERTAFVRDHLDLVLDSAERPFDGHK